MMIILRTLTAAGLALAAATTLFAQDRDEKEVIGQALEYQGALIVPPLWSRGDGEPIFTFAQISDTHHTADNQWQLEKCLAFLTETLRPDFVLFTGDNVSGDTVEHQRRYRALLEHFLVKHGADNPERRIPYFIITGDNDRLHFAEVFGASQFAFSYGGLRFLGLGLDRDLHGDGIGDYRADTLAWAKADLEAHAGQPALVFNHENPLPPVYLGAAQMWDLGLSRRNVVAFLNGHLHYDLHFPLGRITVISAPGLGPNAQHNFKHFAVHPGHITVRTWQLEGDRDGRYQRHARKWQRIGFPRRLRASVGKSATAAGDDGRERFVVEDYVERPYRPVFDPSLQAGKDRAKAVLEQALDLSRALRESLERLAARLQSPRGAAGPSFGEIRARAGDGDLDGLRDGTRAKVAGNRPGPKGCGGVREKMRHALARTLGSSFATHRIFSSNGASNGAPGGFEDGLLSGGR